ncbi:MAG: hypothetical protein HQQ73_09005 [Desulfobulbaceae bacterium]|nr:hypothetical protein [Desulfobulbaceae bacterium]
MIRINLLPVGEIKRRNKDKRELTTAICAVGLFLVLLALVGGMKVMTTKGLKSDLADLQSRQKQFNMRLNSPLNNPQF